AQVAAGAPLLAWAAHRRSPGWATAGAALLAQGTAALAYDRARSRRRTQDVPGPGGGWTVSGPWSAAP
ncbi:hypothetical protein ACWGIU_15030, partial [Streptomyces sp. NPDC054840]